MNAFLESVRNTPTPVGTAALWWLGQMGLLIKMGNTVLSVDYYAADDPDRLIRPPIPMEEVTGIDAFLGTHDHIDHIDHKAWRVWAKTCPDAFFVFPELHREGVLADGVHPSWMIGMDGNDSCHFGDVTIYSIPAAHEFLDRDPATGRFPHLQYIIEGNGVRVYHAGDTVRYEGMLPALQAFHPIDAALLPINGRDGRRYRADCIGNMTFPEAADVAGELGVRLAIPGHWNMFAMNPGDPEAFADYLDAKYRGRVPCLIPRLLEPIMISASYPA